MKDFQLGEQEAKFADIIWENEPIESSALVKLAEQNLNWKKSTTYTMLRRLCTRGIFTNENAMVSALMSKEQFSAGQSRSFIEDNFGGSLPKFLASFISGKKLTDTQADELMRLINEHKEN